MATNHPSGTSIAPPLHGPGDALELKFPLPRSHTGLPLGNGFCGALIWGGEGGLRVTLDRIDFWDHRGGTVLCGDAPCYPEWLKVRNDNGELPMGALQIPFQTDAPEFKGSTRLPVGRMEICFRDHAFPVLGRIDYRTGAATVELNNGWELSLAFAVDAPVLLLDDPAGAIAEIRPRSCWESPDTARWLREERLLKDGAEILREGERIAGWAQSLPSDDSLAVFVGKREGGWVVALKRGADNAEAERKARDLVRQIDLEELRRGSAEWWAGYWESCPKVSLPDARLQQFFDLAVYKFGAATRESAALPPGLQGPWLEDDQPPCWNNDYHFNLNVQQILSLGFPLGCHRHLLPLFDMIESEPFYSTLRHNAKVVFGIDDGLWFTHAVDDRGAQAGRMEAEAVLDAGCGAWTAWLYWMYFRYSGDVEFLEQRALPFLRGVARTFEAMLDASPDGCSIPLATSAEYGCRNPARTEAGQNPSYVLAGLHWLAQTLIEAAGLLGREPDARWQRIDRTVPPFCRINSEDEHLRPCVHVGIWQGQDLDFCHRHHSHLAGIYPFDTWEGQLSAGDWRIVAESLRHWMLRGWGDWCEWAFPWAAILHARSGFRDSPGLMMEFWSKVFLNESLATVYPSHRTGLVGHGSKAEDVGHEGALKEVMQLDGTMGGAEALIEMLVHQRGGVLYVFPAVPETWTDVAFERIRVPGGFQVSATMKNREVTLLRLHSEREGLVRFLLPGDATPSAWEMSPGEDREWCQ